MPATSAPAKADPRQYRMPSVALGATVLWYPDISRRDPAPAIVTAVGPGTVSLSILPPGQPRFTCKDGVRHWSDPSAAKQMGDAGFFGFSAVGRSGTEEGLVGGS